MIFYLSSRQERSDRGEEVSTIAMIGKQTGNTLKETTSKKANRDNRSPGRPIRIINVNILDASLHCPSILVSRIGNIGGSIESLNSI